MPRPDHFTLRKEIRDPLYRRMGEPQNMSGFVRKNLALTGIRSPNRRARSKSLYSRRCLGYVRHKSITEHLFNEESVTPKNALYICSLERDCGSI